MRLFVAIFPPPEALDHLAATVAQLNLTRRIIPPDRWHITLAFLGDVPLALPLPPPGPPPIATNAPHAAATPDAAAAPAHTPRSSRFQGNRGVAAADSNDFPEIATITAAAASGGGAARGEGEGGAGAAGGERGRGVAVDVMWGALQRVGVAVGEVSVASGGRFGQVVWAGLRGDAEGLTRLSRAVRRELRAVRVRSDDKQFRPHLTIARSAAGLSIEDMAKLKAYHGPSWPVSEVVLVRSELGPHPEYSRLGAWPVSSARG